MTWDMKSSVGWVTEQWAQAQGPKGEPKLSPEETQTTDMQQGDINDHRGTQSKRKETQNS